MIKKISECNDKVIKSEGYIHIDPKVILDIDAGYSLIKELVLILLNELRKVSRKGYTKTYNKKIDNINFLRGKLDINKQISKNILGTKFYCKFNELNYYTAENLIVFKAIEKLLEKYNLNKDIRNSLLYYKNEFLNILDIDSINYIDISRLKYSKIGLTIIMKT